MKVESIEDLQIRIIFLENKVKRLESSKKNISEHEDWDNKTLMLKWNICKRTAAYYRKQGLEYYKRGGRVFYSYSNREAFKKIQKDLEY